MKDPLYVYVHLPKSAGTTIKKHLRNSYKKEEVELVILTWDYDEEERKKVHEHFKNLPQAKKDKLKCLYGMNVWYDLKDCFPMRDVRFLTIMREPLVRMISHYRFNVSRTGQVRPMVLVWDDNIEDEMTSDVGGVISFDDWFEKIIQHPNFINNYLERLGFTSPDQFYFIGLVEHSKWDFAFLYHLFGTKKFYDDMNVTERSAVVDVSDDQKSRFYAHNIMDVLWYYKCKDHREQFYEKKLASRAVISRVLFRKKVRLPFRRIRLWCIDKFPLLAARLRKIKKSFKKKEKT